MARIKFGAIVTDARGKLGGHYFNKAKGVATLATKPNAPSKMFYQKNSRFPLLVYAMQYWSAMSVADRQRISLFASNNPFVNDFGDSAHISARAMGLKLLVNIRLQGKNPPSWIQLSSDLAGVEVIQPNTLAQIFVRPVIDRQTTVLVYYYLGDKFNSTFQPERLRFVESRLIVSSGSTINISQLMTSQEYLKLQQVYSFFLVKEVNQFGWSGYPSVLRYNKGQPNPF